jgi:hypothetical protein
MKSNRKTRVENIKDIEFEEALLDFLHPHRSQSRPKGQPGTDGSDKPKSTTKESNCVNIQGYDFQLNKSELEKVFKDMGIMLDETTYPNLFKNFNRLQVLQYELFVNKMNSYGIDNIALGTQLETPEDVKLVLTSIWVRMFDKMNRLKNLVVKGQENTVLDESVMDTWKDLCNYSIIAQLVSLKLWEK